MSDYPVGSRWLVICAEKAQAVRVLQAELDQARRDLDTNLTVASAFYSPTELARASDLSRETVYKAVRRASAITDEGAGEVRAYAQDLGL